MEKGISGCSTLTKLSLLDLALLDLPPQCASASVWAAMALQSSLTEVKWSYFSFRSKSNIGVTVLACGVWCVHVWVGKRQGRGVRDCVCELCTLLLCTYDCHMCMGACLCVCVHV